MNPNVEETLERLYAVEVEHREAVPSPEAEAGLKEALALGLVARTGEDYRLSETGRRAGRDVVRRHRLAECLLRNVVHDDPAYLHEDACQFEHILLHGLAEQICILLGHPKTCPHGRPIPPGPCCEQSAVDQIKEVTPLCDGRPGAEGTVVYLATRNKREVQKMMAMGILPGTPIQLIQRSPSYVFQIAYSQFAVDQRLAAVIIVHWSPPDSAPGS
jgi:DtxR family transcriptional regulator, Mn-dependent transcriptional regulator